MIQFITTKYVNQKQKTNTETHVIIEERVVRHGGVGVRSQSINSWESFWFPKRKGDADEEKKREREEREGRMKTERERGKRKNGVEGAREGGRNSPKRIRRARALADHRTANLTLAPMEFKTQLKVVLAGKWTFRHQHRTPVLILSHVSPLPPSAGVECSRIPQEGGCHLHIFFNQ